MNFTQLFYAEGREGWVFWGSGGVFCGGFWGQRRGANGRFCRGIPGFLGGVWARRGDSAHGGHRRAVRAKKFLKIFKKGVKTRKLGCERGRKVAQGHLI